MAPRCARDSRSRRSRKFPISGETRFSGQETRGDRGDTEENTWVHGRHVEVTGETEVVLSDVPVTSCLPAVSSQIGDSPRCHPCLPCHTLENRQTKSKKTLRSP